MVKVLPLKITFLMLIHPTQWTIAIPGGPISPTKRQKYGKSTADELKVMDDRLRQRLARLEAMILAKSFTVLYSHRLLYSYY